MGEIKNHTEEEVFKNVRLDGINPDLRLDIASTSIGLHRTERYDPDRRIDILNPEKNIWDEFKKIVSEINNKFENLSLAEILSEPFENFLEGMKDNSMDSLVLSTSYVTSCKLACADIIVGADASEEKKENVYESIEKSLETFFFAPEFANKFIQEYGIGPDKVKEAAGEAAEFVLELGKAIFYIDTRITLGLLSIVDNACRAVFSMGLYALGKSDLAKDVMTESKLDEFREYLDKIVKPNELEKNLGDIADKASEMVGELALAIVGALGITASAPVAAVGIVAAAALLGFAEAGKNLETNIEKSGEYGQKEFVSALVTAGLTITVERLLPCLGKITSEANIVKVADRVSKYAKGNMELGAKLTKSILTSLQAGAGMSFFKGADEIKKIVDFELGITDKLDVKKEIAETLGFILGAAALGGVLSYVGDTIIRSKGFQEIVKKFDKDFVYTESKYDVIYKRVELTKEYINDIVKNSTVPDTILKDMVNPEELYRETSDVVAQKRAEFKAKKADLIREWEKETGKEWPRYKEDVVIKLKDGTDMPLHNAGELFDAHHIRPLSWGGENIWQNITPLHADIHFDSRGVHAVESAFDQLSKLMGGLL